MIPFKPSRPANEQSNFYEKSIYVLMKDCIAAIREHVTECPVLMERKGGVIRFDFCVDQGGTKFNKWLGVSTDLPDDFIPESPQFVYRLMPNWPPTIWCEDGTEHGPSMSMGLLIKSPQ